MKSFKSLNRFFWVIQDWFEALECQVSSTNTKPFFGESETNLETLKRISPHIVVFHKFVLKSPKSLNGIFWMIEYWFKALECKIWSTNTKPFFWKSETKLQTLEKLSLYIGVSDEFAFKTLNTLNRIFWPMEYWFKALECQISLTNTKLCFWESKANLILSKNFLVYWSFL